ncbi:MAG: macro domain-containing protein [Mitsuokella multacida]|nr:macro domain-containing protein [Mitsuokella multacida]
MPLIIIRNDITKMQVDAIVNTANPRPVVGGGVDRAIHRVAGPELLAARRKIGDIATGKAFITPGYRLPSKYVIHTVGPVWQGGGHGERGLLAVCYRNSLTLAEVNTCHSVAFPLISAGIFGCPADIAITTAVQAIRDFLQQHECEMDVYLVVFDKKSFQLSDSLFEDVKSYLDEHYVEERLEREYRRDDRGRCLRELMPSVQSCDERLMEAPCVLPSKIPMAEQERSLDDWLEMMDDTFSESLLRLIDRKGKKDPEVYKKANVDRKLFSKIRNNPDYQPSKRTALAFAVALELNLDETRDFIGRAGYALSHSSKLDLVVEYFIVHQEYDIFTINETLFAFGQPLLGC